MRHSGLAVVVALTGWVAFAAQASDSAAAPSIRISQVTVAPDGAVQVTAAAADAKGRPLRGLAASNFEVRVDGAAVRDFAMTRTTADAKPLSVVLALDVSGSMKGNALGSAVSSASRFVDSLAKRDLVALLAFGTGVRQVADFTADRDRVKTALAGLRAADSKTHLYQAVFDALDRASSAPSSRAAAVVLTDGKDEGSKLGLAEVIAKATMREVPVFTVAYGAGADARTLERIAAVSHGESFTATGPEDLARAYSGISDLLQHDSQLSFNLGKPAQKPFQLDVKLLYRGETAAAGLAVTPGSAARPAERTPANPARKPVLPWVGGVLVLACGGAGFYWWYRKRNSAPDIAATMVPPRVWLEVVQGADSGQKFLVFGKEAVIGRDAAKAQIALKNDPMVGRRHAALREDSGGRFLLEDLGSQNGVMLNGVKITEPIALQSDDHIVVGLTELVFVDRR